MVSNVGLTGSPYGAGGLRPRGPKLQDLNGDGKIDFNDFAAGKRQHFLQKTGGSGQLSLAQVQADLVQKVQAGQLDAAKAQAMLSKLSQADLNQDGVIDTNEFEQSLKQKFAKLDKSGDGVIDDAERAAMRAHRHGGGQPPALAAGVQPGGFQLQA